MDTTKNINENIKNKNITENNNKSLIKKYKIPLETEIYLLKIELTKESLIIKASKNDFSCNDFYIIEYSYPEIYKLNEKYNNFINNENLFNSILKDFFESSKIILKQESNNLYLINDNKEFILKKYIPNEDEFVDDIFNKLSILEEQINNFTNYGQKVTN